MEITRVEIESSVTSCFFGIFHASRIPVVMSSISDILQQTLDLIGSEPTASSTTAAVPAFGASGAPQPAPTASSVLLEERRKLKQRMDEINAADFSGVSSDRPQVAPMSALMNQVASSSVDAPKYWKSKKNGNGAVSSNKKTLEKRNKGSDYNDRLMNKLQSKESKLKLKNKLKGK